MELVVEGFASANSNIENTLDNIATEVEEALGSDTDLNGTCLRHNITNTEITLNNEGSKPIGVVRLTFSVTYRTTQANVEALI